MLALERHFGNLFSDPRITTYRLVTFTLDHLGRLQAANPGAVYDPIIADTQLKVGALQNATGIEVTEFGESKGSTVTKKQARKNFQDYISQKEGLIKSTFGEGSPQYIEFFPTGLTGYRNATDIQFKDLANNAVTKAGDYEVQLGVTFKNELTALRNAYITAKDTQANEEGDVDAAATNILTLEHDLEVQLSTNIFTIALQNSDGPATVIASTYFDEGLLFGNKTKRIYRGTVDANTTKKVFDLVYEPAKQVYAENKGGVTFSLQMLIDGVPYGTIFTVQPGEKINKRYDQFFSNGTAVQITNATNAEGKYVIEDRI